MNKLIKISFVFYILIALSKSAYPFTSLSSLYLMSNAAIQSYDYEKAALFFNEEKNDDSNSLQDTKKMITYINSNKLKKANIVAKEIIKSDAKNENAWIVLLSSGIINNEKNIFNKFINKNFKENFKIINYVFFENEQLQYKNNRYIAEKFFDLIQETDPSSFKYPKNIENYLFYLNLALIHNPSFNEAIFVKAQLYQQLKFYERAEKLYDKILENHNLYIEAQKNNAIIKKNNNNFVQAEKLLINLSHKHPNDNSLIMMLANLFRENKKYNKAIEFYSSLIDKQIIGNDTWVIYYMRGMCYEKSNNWQKAEKDFLKALEIDPEQPQVLNYLAYSWIEQNYYLKKSLEMLRTAAKINPKSHYILDSLAWAHYKLKNFEVAVQIMEQVIEIAPGEAVSLDHLGDIYFALGRKREASFMWSQALDLAEPSDDIIKDVKIKIDEYNAG